MTVNVLETLTNPGDSIVGRLVGFEASPEAPSEYGVLTLDNGITIDLDLNDNLRREMDGILDAYYEENPDGQPFVRIAYVEPEEVARPDKDFTPKFAHAVIIDPEES